MPSQAGEVRGLELVLVNTLERMRIWNELMITDHPQGAGPLMGRQLRYLIGSQHGWLGGFGFAAAALQLADRDAWVGWDREQRQAHFHGVVGMSRFLIRPSVQCRNLASKVLGMVMAAMPKWSKANPFHWLESAQQGDAEAMLQLGIIAHRKSDMQKAKHWHDKSFEAGHPDAKQRLRVLSRCCAWLFPG